jgi:carboxyl-terminal processing protease
MKHPLRVWIPVGIILLAAAFLGGIWASGTPIARLLVLSSLAPDPQAGSTPDFTLIRDAWAIINRVYVDRSALQSRPLTYGAIGGMVDALGDTGHSSFLTPEMVLAEKEITSGRYTGVGLEIRMKDGQVTIVTPFDGSPADKAGLRAGEIIVKVDGLDVSGLSLQQVVQRILGPEGSSVTLTVFSPATQQTLTVTVKRAKIAIHNVSWQVLPGSHIVDLRIAAFSQGVTQDLVHDLDEIKREGYKDLILDLRNNPGGLLEEAVGVASQFLSSGDVLLEKDAKGQVRPVPVSGQATAAQIKMAVLVNAGTASAAEIVAGALQDAGRARVVGEKTFGTGTVLSPFPLPDGSQLLLAVEEWLTPKGHVIWHKGIEPDTVVALPAGATMLAPEEIKGMSADQLQAAGDAQLREAMARLE